MQQQLAGICGSSVISSQPRIFSCNRTPVQLPQRTHNSLLSTQQQRQPSGSLAGALQPAVPLSRFGSSRCSALPEISTALTTSGQLLMDTAEAGRLFIPGVVGDDQLREGFVSGFLLIFFSEIGDKTFFIALLLALRNPQGAVFTGTFGALAVMTVISVLLGRTLHLVDELVPLGDTALGKLPFDDLLAAALLIWFGIQTIRNAGGAADSANEEKEEAAEVVESISAEDLTKLILTTFTLVFAAEWGDKSFLATIALAAASSPVGVTGGAVAGHGVATALAVAGGSVLTKYISPTLLQYLGGGLFLVFAASTLLDVAVEMSGN